MIEIKNVCYAYPLDGEQIDSLRNINLTIHSGEVVVLCGKSGCGKTTLTRVINGLIPHFYEGEMSGEVIIGNKNITTQSLEETAKTVGSVFQNPRSQFFNVDTTGELAFGCENISLEKQETKKRLKEVEGILNLNELLDRNIFELSGDEKQRIACASVYAVHPDVFVFDEPSSNLDQKSIQLLREAIKTLVSKNKTVIIAEHRLYYLTGLATRYVFLQDGCVAAEFDADQMLSLSDAEREKMGLRSMNFSDKEMTYTPVKSFKSEKNTNNIYIEQLQVCYDDNIALNVQDFSLEKHSIVAIIGENGAGKSTFAKTLVGLQKSKEKIFLDAKPFTKKARLAKSYMVMQDVNHQLFTESVSEELKLNLDENKTQKIPEVLERLSLSDYENRHPRTLSGGQNWLIK